MDDVTIAKTAAEQLVQQATESLNLHFRPQIVLPGDNCSDDCFQSTLVELGNGLNSSRKGEVIASKAGLLSYKAPHVYEVDNHQKRYIPRADDPIIGIVEDRGAEQYRLNIFGSTNGFLGHLDFEGATKRNNPSLKVGSLVYCRVSLAIKGMDIELSCIATQGVKKDWMTGEATFGELKGGLLTHCSQGLCRQLLLKDSAILQALTKTPFEIAVGINGCFWLNAGDNYRTAIALRNAIINSESVHSRGEMAAMVKHVLQAAKR